MSLAAGTRLGPFEVTALLGQGGMGAVYRARDTKLDRDVALKILPESFATDPDRLMRFEREAKTLASLNHPHIAQIHGFEQSGKTSALVMELVDGEDLSQRISRGAIPIDEALPIAKQIAEALEAAHEQGIVHRDLKPANIKVREDGTVKVLDFGLAKALQDPKTSGPQDLVNSPTITSPAMTQAGIILGTAAYMAPEQAKGKGVDKRADIWAFGVVLYEMLTGRRAFDGEDVSDLLVAVLSKDVNLEALPATVPPRVIQTLRLCLRKDPKQRLGDIRDVRLALEGAFDVPPAQVQPPAQTTVAPRPLWKRALPVVSAAIVAGAIVGAVAWMQRPPTPIAPPVVRFSLPLGDGERFTVTNNQMLDVSPDGQLITYFANDQLYLRSMSESAARPITGTQAVRTPFSPVFSPDSKWIAFYSAPDQAIKKVSVNGGAAITVCPATPARNGRLTWDGNAIFFGQRAGVMRVPETGGEPELLVKISEDQGLHGPQLLPGGEWILFTLSPQDPLVNQDSQTWDSAQVVAQSIKTGERRTIVDGGSDGRYLPSGHLVYAAAGVLFAARFDLKTLSVVGDRVPVVEGIQRALTGLTAATQFAVSRTGTLVYVPGPKALSAIPSDLALVDRQGTVERLGLPASDYAFPRLSPDSTRIAFQSSQGGNDAIWIYEMAGRSSRRLTIEGRNRVPVWSPDGASVAFQSDREGGWALYRQRADGSAPAERLTTPNKGDVPLPESWSPDGRTLLFSVLRDGRYSLETLSLADRRTTRFGEIQSNAPTAAAFSPDGKWVAYNVRSANDLGGVLFVQPFPPTGATYRVSAAQGFHAVWSSDGKELIYVLGPSQLGVVRVAATESVFTFGNPALGPVVFSIARSSVRSYDVGRDGRVLGVVPVVPTGSLRERAAFGQELQVVLNWFTELQQRVPTTSASGRP